MMIKIGVAWATVGILIPVFFTVLLAMFLLKKILKQKTHSESGEETIQGTAKYSLTGVLFWASIFLFVVLHFAAGIIELTIWLLDSYAPSRSIAIVHAIHVLIFSVVAVFAYTRARNYIFALGINSMYSWIYTHVHDEEKTTDALDVVFAVAHEIIGSKSNIRKWLIPYMAKRNDENDYIDAGRAAIADVLHTLMNPVSGASKFFMFTDEAKETIVLLMRFAEKIHPDTEVSEQTVSNKI